MTQSAVHNLEICTVLRVLAASEAFSLENTFQYSQVLGASMKAFVHWSLEWETKQINFAGGNWSAWSILADSSSIHFGSKLRALAVFPGSIYSGYSDHCKVFRMFVRRCCLCTRGSVYCSLIFPALSVFGPSVLLILPVLAVLFSDSIILE